MRHLTTLLLLLCALLGQAQTPELLQIDSIPLQGLVLNRGWKWHAGDDPNFAKVDFDDSDWESIDPSKDIIDLPQIQDGKVAWLRLKIRISPDLVSQPIMLLIQQAAATEVYVDGRKLAKYGSIDSFSVTAVYVAYKLLDFPVTHDSVVLAVRFAYQKGLPRLRFAGQGNYCFKVSLMLHRNLDFILFKQKEQAGHPSAKTSSFIVLFILHFMFFWFYPSQKTHLFFSIMALFLAIHHFMWYVTILSLPVINLTKLIYFGLIRVPILGIGYSFLLTSIYSILNYKKDYIFWVTTLLTFLLIVGGYLNYHNGILILEPFTIFFNSIAAIYITIKGLIEKKRFANLLLWGIIVSLSGNLARWLPHYGIFPEFANTPLSNFMELIGTLSIPMSVSLLLGQDFAQTSKNLQKKLDEVERLAKEKQQILSTQNETLERLVTERTTELEQKNQKLKLESSLERVRSQAMAMHKSEELQEVVNTIFDQFKTLKIEVSTANILVFSERSQDMTCWTSNYNNRFFRIPFANVPILVDLDLARKKGQRFFSKTYTPDEKNQLFEYFFEKTDFREIPEDRKKQILLSRQYTLSAAFFGDTAVQLTSYSRDAFSEDENKILLRFADAFFQAYTRFQDLQKVEMQAREAQIEVALERVRSRTMAMYKSEEVAEVAAVLFQQIRLLGELPDRLSIGIFEEENGRAQVWTTDQTGFQLSGRFFARLTEETSVQKMYSCWKSGQKTQVIDLQEEEFKRWLQFVREELKIDVDATHFQGRRVHNIAYFSQGWLDVLSLEPLSPEMLGILLRFANVFSLSYARFLDLQRAEKQTREARIEASLVRIRAEIASMRGPEDLQHITPLVWKELTNLEVPFFRCGVFIVDEELEKVHTYLSTPDGQAIASFNLSFDSEGPTWQIVTHWRKQQIFLDDWDESQFQSWAQSLVDQGIISSSQTYTAYMPARLFLHFIPFLQGMLYVGGEAPLSPEATQVVQSLTAAFATAYARYQDFTKLEAAKQQVESALKELQSTQAQLIQSEKLASLGELTAGIAHEIQNPLNFVNNFAEVSAEMLGEMEEELDKGDTQEAKAIAGDLKTNLEKINHHGQRASSIVKGMLEHSRQSRDATHRVSTDINALTDEYLRLAYHGWRAKDNSFNCKIETHFDPNLPKVSAIPQDIGRVLLNLVNNAFYAVHQRTVETLHATSLHTLYQPVVTVSTRKMGNQITIKVQDNGNGIPEAIREKIFQPFFTTKPTGQGTGLGLSLAYDIIKVHGGALEVSSMPKESTTFIVSLPI